MPRRVWTFMLIIVLALPAVAAAQQVELTPFIGYRFGGELEDLDVRSEVDLEESESYGLVLGFAINPSAWIELFWSHQESSVEERIDFFGNITLFDLDVDYYHVAFLYQWNARGVTRPFVVGSLGITELSPGLPAFDSETRFSMGFGGGVKFMFADNFGIRLEGRGITSFIEDDEEVFCDPFFCYGYTDEEVLWQFEARFGLILAF